MNRPLALMLGLALNDNNVTLWGIDNKPEALPKGSQMLPFDMFNSPHQIFRVI